MWPHVHASCWVSKTQSSMRAVKCFTLVSSHSHSTRKCLKSIHMDVILIIFSPGMPQFCTTTGSKWTRQQTMQSLHVHVLNRSLDHSHGVTTEAMNTPLISINCMMSLSVSDSYLNIFLAECLGCPLVLVLSVDPRPRAHAQPLHALIKEKRQRMISPAVHKKHTCRVSGNSYNGFRWIMYTMPDHSNKPPPVAAKAVPCLDQPELSWLSWSILSAHVPRQLVTTCLRWHE